MLTNIPNVVSTIPRLVVIPLLLLVFTLYYYQLSNDAGTLPITPKDSLPVNSTETLSAFNTSIVVFWKELAPTLQSAKPLCKPLGIVNEILQDSSDHVLAAELNKDQSQQLSNFTDEDETALLRAHYKMRRSAQYLAPKLPVVKERTGIVTTASPGDMPAFLISLRMLRRTGCNLPMEVYIEDWTHYDSHTCNVLLSSLHARCIILSDLYNTNITSIRRSNHAHNKIISLLFSSFQNILYLDIGAMPTYDPTMLFSIPPYTTHGLITWPDFHPLTASEHFYHIAGIPVEPALSRSATSGGHIMLNKLLHRETLLMMLYYTSYGPTHFFPLLCASRAPSCVKEVFVAAAAAVSLPYYQVRTKPHTLGRWRNGTYNAVGLASADPGLDHEYLAPISSHIHPDEHWLKLDVAHPNATVEKKLNITRHVPHAPRPVFVHHDIAVLDLNPKTVLADKDAIMYETDGVPSRIWGHKDGMVGLVGYDVERRMWDVVAAEACRVDAAAEECRDVGEFVREVFGWMDSIDRPW